MSLQVLCSDITVGSFRFAGEAEVVVKRSLHSYADYAMITVPSISKVIMGKSASGQVLTTASRFNDGDLVTINVGYNDSYLNYQNPNENGSVGPTPVIAGNNNGLRTVFQGFVKRMGLGMPLQIECEGYIRPLRLGIDITMHKKTAMASDLLNLCKNEWSMNGKNMVKGKSTGIKVIVADDLPLQNVTLNHNNGVEIIEAIKRFSEGVLNVFFINPTTLWCGLTYTPYRAGTDPFGLGIMDYRLGWNCPKNNSLKERQPVERVQIIFGGTQTDGKKLTTASDDVAAARKHKKILNHVGDITVMKKMANEQQYMKNYTGYEGTVTGFLVPWCVPGFVVNITDARYPALNGSYMVEGIEVTYGLKGARSKVQVGPQLGFASR